jgi:chromosome segregation ATPase
MDTVVAGINSATGNGINIANASEITDPIANNISSLGSDVTQLQGNVALLETVVDPNGLPLDERDTQLRSEIENLRADVDTEFTNLGDALTEAAQEAGLTAAQQEVATLEASITLLREGLDDTIERGNVSAAEVVAIQDAIAAAEQNLAETIERLDTTQEEAAQALSIGQSAAEQAIAAVDRANEAEGFARNAEAAAEAAQNDVSLVDETLTAAQEQVRVLETSLEALTNQLDTVIREGNVSATTVVNIQDSISFVEGLLEETRSNIDRVEFDLSERTNDIKKLNKTASRADTNAKQALNLSRRGA